MCEQVTIGFRFTSDWTKKWYEFLSQSLLFATHVKNVLPVINFYLQLQTLQVQRGPMPTYESLLQSLVT